MITKSPYPENDPSSPESRGRRLKTLRKLVDLTREAVSQRYAISPSTLRSWEDGRATGLTEQGARRMIAVFQSKGIQCNIAWLLYGKGEPPLIEAKSQVPEHRPIAGINTEIANELDYFIEHHPNATYLIVQDDGMEPLFLNGDYVAGNQRYDEAIEDLIGHTCIVETKSGEKYLRLLRKGSKSGLYHLLCINHKTSVKLPALYDAALISAAPVIWWRRDDTFYST